VRGDIQCGKDCFEHAIRIGQNIIVPESKHSISLVFEKFCSTRIGLGLLAMLSSIQFNDEHGFRADEIGDEGADGKLPPEFMSAEASIAQVEPQTSFGICLIDA
jgi:hypothetical protein